MTCSYKYTPDNTGSEARAWSRVRLLEKRIQRLSKASPEFTDDTVAEPAGSVDFDDGGAASSSEDIRVGNHSNDNLETPSTSIAAENQQSEITVVEDGSVRLLHLFHTFEQADMFKVAYFGATSRFHHEPAENNAAGLDRIDLDFHRKWLTSNARFQSSWETIAYENLAKDPTLDPHVAYTLLKIYWTWQAPLHNCVYRACK